MYILTNENKAFSMNSVPDEVDDLMYGVLDITDQNDIDYKFLPMMWLERFTSAAAGIKIGDYVINVPISWHILILALDQIEIIKIEHLMDKDFKAFCLNPLSSYMPDFLPIEIIEIYPEVEWYLPEIRNGHILTVPLTSADKPQCAYFVKDTHRISDTFGVGQLM